MNAKRKLAAILSADAAGYSKLMADDDAATLRSLNDSRALFRERIEAHGGRVIDTAGDSVLAEFPSAVEAVDCAVEIQHELAKRNHQLAEYRRMQFRIGINLGDVIEQEDGTIYGDGVNVAARLQALAEPGGICISGTAFDHVEGKLPVQFKFIGAQQVKNIAKPVRAYHIMFDAPLYKPSQAGTTKRQRQMRRALIGIGGVLVVGGLTGSWAWRRGPTQTGPINNRIAVLPFVSMSAGAEDEYFVDGMTEELISRLSRVKGLEVIARTSIASYKGSKKKIGEIAGELNVGTVLEGSARTAGGKVRITAQLINATNDAHLWSEDYDREMKDIFAVQTDIAQQVANALAARLALVSGLTTLAETHAQEFKGAGTKDLDAYNAYLKGRFYANKGTVEDLRKSIPYFEDAIRRDPSYALAYAGLADAYGNLAGYEGATAGLYTKVKSAALKALQLDESLAEAHTSIGIVKAFYDYDLPGAGEEFRRALALNPNSAMTHDWYSYYLLFFPRWDEAVAVQRRAVQLDPLAIIISTDLGWVLEHAGRWDEAIEHLRKTLELDPGNALLLGALGLAYAGKGMYPEALEAFQKRIDTSGRDADVLFYIAQVHALSGDTTKALQILEEAKDKSRNQPGHAFNFAQTYRVLAARDKRYREDMYAWLDKAYAERSMGLVFISAAEWEPFRSDSRFIALRKKLGLEP